MADLNQVNGAINAINQSLGKYIVSPLNAFGIGGFTFDVEGESTVNIQTEITDHYIEDNSAIQDHIAVKPKKITLKNYVGELVYRLDGDTNTPAQKLTQKLTVLNSYLPVLAAGAKQANNIFQAAKKAQSVFSTTKGLTDFVSNNFASAQSGTVNIWNLIKNVTPPTSRQQQAYMFFKALAEQKVLVSVQTPFEFMSNMAIESIVGIQGEESRYISNFAITLKEIRTVSTLDVPFDPAKYSERTLTQTLPTTQSGTVQGLAPSALPASNPLSYPATPEDLANLPAFQDMFSRQFGGGP